MLKEAQDLRDEARELHRLLEPLKEEDWSRETAFKRWTIDDIVQHLHATDLLAAASLAGPEAFAEMMGAIRARRDGGLSRVEETRARVGNLTGRKLLARWQEELERLCANLEVLAPDTRLKWAGPDMGVRMFTTARQMETWAHGQAIYDLLGLDRRDGDRLQNIAVIGVKTFGWTFANRGLPLPGDAPHVRLTAPSGAIWTWNPPSEDNLVEGDAVAFCQVTAQTRNVADTALTVRGEPARAWMAMAQCFAGPPEDPPAPGTRRRAA